MQNSFVVQHNSLMVRNGFAKGCMCEWKSFLSIGLDGRVGDGIGPFRHILYIYERNTDERRCILRNWSREIIACEMSN